MSERRAPSVNEEIRALRRDVNEKLTGWERVIAWEGQLAG